MAIEMVIFDLKENEKSFFENNRFENFKFTFFSESLTPQSVRNIPADIKDNTVIISVFTDSEVSEDVIREFKNLRIISTRSTAYDHISKKEALERNIAVLNVPDYGRKSVAQFTFCLIFALIRNLMPSQKDNVNLEDIAGHDVSKLSIGIVGTGSIGDAVCKIANFFNMKIYGYDLRIKKELINKYNVEYLDFNNLLKKSDIITVHIPYTCDNFHMFSNDEFSLMKENSYFINTSSIRLVDCKSLYESIATKKIKGAALDTNKCPYKNNICRKENSVTELCREEEVYIDLMKQQNNVIITPHIAYNTEEAVNYILENTMNQIRNNLKGENIYGIL